jgi:hypothetical protein
MNVTSRPFAVVLRVVSALQKSGIQWMSLISVSLILEYEAVGKREAQRLKIPSTVEQWEVDIYFNLRLFRTRAINLLT